MRANSEDEIRQAIEGDAQIAGESYDSAVAVDPGTTTGVAIAHSTEEIDTRTMDFWALMKAVLVEPRMLEHEESVVWVVEAPYMTKWGKAQDNSAMAYNSGGVAREAELLVEGIDRSGHEVIEHDPHSSGNSAWSGGKWDSETAHRIVGEWEGPDNEHTRDAIRLLVSYGFVG